MVRLGYGRRAFVLASGAAAVVRPAAAQPAPAGPPAADLLARRLFFAAPDHGDAVLSPDGGKLAFLAPVDGVQNVWVAPVDDIKSARALTKAADRDLFDRLWWPQDNRHVVYFRDRAGDENWQAHAVDVESGESRALSPEGARCFVQQVSARFPGELLLAHNQRDRSHFDLYRVNAASGESKLVFLNDAYADLFTDTHFRVPYGMRYREGGGWDMVKTQGDDAGKVYRSVAIADRYCTELLAASDDGKYLYWLDSRNRDSAAVVAEEVATGKQRVLVENRSADFSEPIFDPVKMTPIAASLIYTRRRWYPIDPSAAPDIDRIQASIDGDVTDFGLSNDREHWVVYAEPAPRPGRYFHYRRKDRKAVPLFSERAGLDEARLVKMEPVVIPTRGELRLVSYLTRGAGIEMGQPGPMVMLVHDGPWTRVLPEFNPVHQWLANRGYNVLSVNFRGSTGLGKKTANAGDGEWGDKMQHDLLDAMEWANNERISDELRIAIAGAGYGGYAALMGGCLTPDRFACAIDFGGITDLVALSAAGPAYLKPAAPGLKVRMGADGTSPEGRKFLASRSPLTYVDRLKCPLLIAHGANDAQVPVAQSDAFVAAMQKNRQPVTYVVYGDEGHVFRRAPNRVSLAAIAEAFLAENLGGRAEPVGDALNGATLEFRAGRELIKGLG